MTRMLKKNLGSRRWKMAMLVKVPTTCHSQMMRDSHRCKTTKTLPCKQSDAEKVHELLLLCKFHLLIIMKLQFLIVDVF